MKIEEPDDLERRVRYAATVFAAGTPKTFWRRLLDGWVGHHEFAEEFVKAWRLAERREEH